MEFLANIILAVLLTSQLVTGGLQGVDEAEDQCAKEGITIGNDPENDPNFPRWYACVLRKVGLIKADGTIDLEIYKDFLGDFILDADIPAFLEYNCHITSVGDSDEETAVNLLNCIRVASQG